MSTPLPKSFLRGRSMGEAISTERRATIRQLQQHGLETAAFAMGEQRSDSFSDWLFMRSAILAGGIHTVRLRGGRSIDPR